MFNTKLSDYWSVGVRRFLKPKELIKGLMSIYRLLLTSLEDASMLGNTKPPVGHSTLYKTLTLPLDSVKTAATVAGMAVGAGVPTASGSLISGSGPTPVSSATFTYMITDAPSGLICFSKCVDSNETLCLYSDFVELNGVYYFTKDPSNYGIISTSSGAPTITFTVTGGSSSDISFQDGLNKYNGSPDYHTNVELHYRDSFEGVLPGNGKLYLESCGVSSSLKASQLVKVWTEGDSTFAKTDSGDLLKDSLGSLNEVDGLELSAGEPLTPAVFNEVHLYPVDSTLYGFLGTSGTIGIDEYRLNQVLPEFAGATLQKTQVADILTDRGYVTLARTNPMPIEAQQAIDRRVDKLSTQYVADVITIKTKAISATHPCIYVYFTTDKRKDVQPVVYSGIPPRNAVYDNFPAFGVLRISLQRCGDRYLAVSDNGECMNQIFKCGSIIKAVSIVSAASDGKFSDTDSIVEHIAIPEVAVGAGGSAVFVLEPEA